MFKKLLVFLLPWPARRYLLVRWFGFKIHPTARIGRSWIFPKQLEMGADSKIEHFNIAINLERVQLGSCASIGRFNWITGFPKNAKSAHFAHQDDREPELVIGEHSAITKNHHIDCTNSIKIGSFTTIAGYYSQLLTHSIDIYKNRQDSAPIVIGDYCFVGTNVVALGGTVLPDYSVLGAKSLVNKGFHESYFLYGGNPARPIKELPQKVGYFHRSVGRVN